MWRRISKREYYRICRMEKTVCKAKLIRRLAWAVTALVIFFTVSYNNHSRECERLKMDMDMRRFDEFFMLDDYWSTNDPYEEVMDKWEIAYGDAMRKDYERLKGELDYKYMAVCISGVIAAAVLYGLYSCAVHCDRRRFLEHILFAQDGVCVERKEGRKRSATLNMDVNDGKTITDIQVPYPISGWIACGDSLMMVSGWTEAELAELDGMEKEFRVYPIRMKRIKGETNKNGNRR